jgi:two-component system phosphate regulon sensor histidine kinase PhoR
MPSNAKLKQDFFEDKSIEDVNQQVVKWGLEKEKQIKNLKSLESYRKDFIGNISHELKTPIFSIQGYLYTLLDGAMKDKKLSKRYLKRAAENVDRLQNIVDDLEIITKLEEGKKELKLTSFILKDLVREVIVDLRQLAKDKGIAIGLKVGAEHSYSVVAERESIRQVLINLIVNTIKYGKEGGHTKISMYDMDENILIEISDDGIGIAEEHINHVFDRFYRVDQSRSRNLGGSGLGLSIVKHIIEAHHQNINIRSTLGVGSTFGFTLKKA